MAKYVAFLRAINVGGHVAKMDALKALFETLKMKATFRGIRTMERLAAKYGSL